MDSHTRRLETGLVVGFLGVGRRMGTLETTLRVGCCKLTHYRVNFCLPLFESVDDNLLPPLNGISLC